MVCLVVVVCLAVVVGLALVVVGLTVVVVVLLVVVVVAEVVVDEGATVVDTEPVTVVWGAVVGGSVEVDVTLVTVVREVLVASELRLWMPKYQPSTAPHATTSTAKIVTIQTQDFLLFVPASAACGPA